MMREFVIEPCEYDTRDVIKDVNHELIVITKDGLLLVTQEMWWKLCDGNLWEPIKLQDADVSKPFVYDRKFGLFYVSMGYHAHVMRFLLGLHMSMNHKELEQFMIKEIGEYSAIYSSFCTNEYADYYLKNFSGTAFKSSVGTKILCGRFENLNYTERKKFKPIGLDEVFGESDQ